MSHGWTSHENADAYEQLLRTEIFEGIVSRTIDGFSGIDLLRRDHAQDVEFVTVMWFASLAAVQAFAGRIAKPRWCPQRLEPFCAGSTRGLRITRSANGGLHDRNALSWPA